MLKNYFSTMLHPAFFILTTTLALSAFSAEENTENNRNESTVGQIGAITPGDMEALRERVYADKRLVIAGNMQLSDAEAKKFWPVYEAYQNDLHNLNEKMVRIINEYSLAYSKGAILNSTAKRLLDDTLALEMAEARLKQSYVPILSKALPATKMARYLQIENKIRALIRYELAKGIPLAN